MAPIKRTISADVSGASAAAGYQWLHQGQSPSKGSRPLAKPASGAFRRTASVPSGKATLAQASNPACSQCRVGRAADEAVVVCERCVEWSHAACAGTSGGVAEASYLCSRCCQMSTTEEDLSPDDPGDSKDYSGSASLHSSHANSPASYPMSMINGEYSVATIAPASLHDAEATYICPVCDIDCTCENKQQARRNSIYSGPVEIFDKPSSKPGIRKNSAGPAASVAASQPPTGAPPLKRQRTMSADDGVVRKDTPEKSPSKKEERIIACTQDGCDKVYTTMAGLRYHLKTFDHQKNKRKDSIDGGSTVASAAPSTVASPTSSGLSPTTSAAAAAAASGAASGAAGLAPPSASATSTSSENAASASAASSHHGMTSSLGHLGGGSLSREDLSGADASLADSSDADGRPGSGASSSAFGDAMDALEGMHDGVGVGNGGRRSAQQNAPSLAMARRLSYFSESEDDSFDEDDEDDGMFSSAHHSSVIARRHSYPGHSVVHGSGGSGSGSATRNGTSGGSSGRRSMMFEQTAPFVSSPIFYPTSPQMLPLDLQGSASFSLDLCTPLMASMSGDLPAEWDF